MDVPRRRCGGRPAVACLIRWHCRRKSQQETDMSYRRMIAAAVVLISGAGFATAASAVDADAAQALLKKNNCLKCHAVDKKKEGPAFKETAAKYKGKADAEEQVITFVTTSPKVKVDGKEEAHESIKTKNEAEVR